MHVLTSASYDPPVSVVEFIVCDDEVVYPVAVKENNYRKCKLYCVHSFRILDNSILSVYTSYRKRFIGGNASQS